MIEEALYDYLLVINPDAETAADVKRFKGMIANEIGSYTGLHSKAHISLFRSEFPDRYEETFTRMLDKLSNELSAFTIYTSRVDHFKHGDHKRTIYVNVANPRPVEELHRRIVQLFELKVNSFKPHITLARAIPTEAFNQVYPQFENKLFVRSFHCHSFLLLKRPAAGGSYEIAKEFVFGNHEMADGPLFHHGSGHSQHAA
ncbi:2'-5' RNA ligase family protein [Chitinophaga sedimenti]|uniref:2'-5' RNA ligase family protein n=1 Tax=Chitinophaga sedimenti TaxID=2033606 RepID=UPI002003D93A|nr:2'-5' RNA ligase family protein [Chitinophaga sedimenti]MCK7553897.1 2'-5' RNA ligase family protein [Chitinophaga sedimenti]